MNYIHWIDVTGKEVKLKRWSNNKWYPYLTLLVSLKKSYEDYRSSEMLWVQFWREYNECIKVLHSFSVKIPKELLMNKINIANDM